jgi:hypothetical protein
MPTYASRSDAQSLTVDAMDGASARLLRVVEEQAWTAQQPVGQAIAVLLVPCPSPSTSAPRPSCRIGRGAWSTFPSTSIRPSP